MSSVDYNEIRKNLDTGDLVFFSGRGPISNMIKVMTRSKWSHVGMVLKIHKWDMVLLWESTTLSPIKDLQSGTVRQGIQLVPLSERLKAYKGTVGIRLLNVHKTAWMKARLSMLRREVAGRSYEQDKIELFKSLFNSYPGAEDLSSLFCSEVVAEAYQRMELLEEPPKGLPSNRYTPASLADFSLQLKNGFLSTVIDVQVL